jgi:hypothetical protein
MEKRNREWWLRLGGFIALAAAVGLLAGSVRRQHALYDPGAAEFGMVSVATNISESALVIDATFTGVERRPDGHLYSTYDRTKPLGGKQPCLT